MNVAVLLALGVAKWTDWMRADPAFALLIALYMLWNAYRIAQEALVQLLDQELSSEHRLRIRNAVLACDGVRNVHDLRTRFSGDRIFVEYHLEVDGDLSVARGHEIGDVTEHTVERLLPNTVEVTAHLEPFVIDD